MTSMELAILFWFYKEPEICENRLQMLKKYNPELKIYGLYGGKISEVSIFKDKLGKYLNDFYVFSANVDEDWKWINGDQMILDWYEKRGKHMKWDSVAVIQWDALVFDSLQNLFPEISKSQLFLSGLRNLDEETENRWDWTSPSGKERKNYLDFLEYVKKEYGYSGLPLCSLFILQIFPRIFFERYLSVEKREIGMLEYKIPVYAEIFKIPFYRKELGVCWFGDPRPMNAIPEEIPEEYIKNELGKVDGWRIFHPYYGIWKI